MATIPSAAAATAAYRQVVEAKRAAQVAEAAKPFDQAAWEEEQGRLARERAAALPAELEQARKEYMEYLRGLIATAIQEDLTFVGYWDIHDSAKKKRIVAMEEFHCARKYCCGEELGGGEPAMLEWEFIGLNNIAAFELLWPNGDRAAHPILTEIKEELEALGYTVECDDECLKDLRFQITYPV